MRHKITLALCLLAVAALSVLSLKAYRHYQANHDAVVAHQAQQRAIGAKNKTAAQIQSAKAIQALEALCQKDLASYNALPAIQKAKVQAPDCTLPAIQ